MISVKVSKVSNPLHGANSVNFSCLACSRSLLLSSPLTPNIYLFLIFLLWSYALGFIFFFCTLHSLCQNSTFPLWLIVISIKGGKLAAWKFIWLCSWVWFSWLTRLFSTWMPWAGPMYISSFYLYPISAQTESSIYVTCLDPVDIWICNSWYCDSKNYICSSNYIPSCTPNNISNFLLFSPFGYLTSLSHST